MNLLILNTLFVGFHVGAVFADNDYSAYDQMSSLDKALPDIFQTKMQSGHFINTVKLQCKKMTGNDEAFEKVVQALNEFKICFDNIDFFNPRIIGSKKEFLSFVNKSCMSLQTLNKCLQSFVKSTVPCFKPEDNAFIGQIRDLLLDLLNFICHNKGERVDLFFAHNGEECLQQSAKALEKCAEPLVASYASQVMETQKSSMTDFSKLIAIDAKECEDLNKLQDCAVRELAKCEDPTPASLADDMLKIVVNFTCSKTNAADEQQLSTVIILGTTAMTLIVRSRVSF